MSFDRKISQDSGFSDKPPRSSDFSGSIVTEERNWSNLTSLPSRYLKPSQLSPPASDICSPSSQSTISESDLCPSTDEIFRSGEDAVAALQQDEISWIHERYIPAPMVELSAGNHSYEEVSVGLFFKQRSDDLSNIFGKSPEKAEPNETLTVSHIAKVLSNSKLTPFRAVDYLQSVKEKCDDHPEKRNETTRSVDCGNIRSGICPDLPQTSRTSGKLPIATTKTEILWGCIKPGKISMQNFIISNRSARLVEIQCSVSKPSFRLIGKCSQLQISSELEIRLRPHESRKIFVSFAPTTLGAAADLLTFTSPHSTVKQFIKLSAYGGGAFLKFEKMIRNESGKFLLSFGNLEGRQMIEKIFSVKNCGSLPGFSMISLVTTSLFAFSTIKVIPKTIVVLPGEKKKVVVTYIPQKRDFEYIQSKMNTISVIDIGKLAVIHGSEVNRGRLRRLYEKAKQRGVEVDQAFYKLTEKFPGEVMPTDLKYLQESPASIVEILKLFDHKEIIITVEQDLDLSQTRQLQDETAMFFSLCEDTKFGIGDSTITTCHVEPSTVILKPPHKFKDMIFLTNNSEKKLYFQISCTPDGLGLKPRSGDICPNQTIVFDVEYNKFCTEITIFKVTLVVDHESFQIDVKVMQL